MIDAQERLVYLDTSHQHYLAQVAIVDPFAFERFVRKWRDGRCCLVVTHAHLLENRQHPDPAIRRQRITLFKALAPVVTDVPLSDADADAPALLVEREILRALFATKQIEARNAESSAALERWRRIFLGRCETPESVNALDLLNDPKFDLMSSLWQSAARTAASARTRANAAPYERLRLRELPTERSSPEQITEAREAMRATIAAAQMWEDLREIMAPEALSELRASVEDMVERALALFESTDPRTAFVESLGLSNGKRIARRYTDTLVQQHMFEAAIRQLLSRFALPESEVEHVATNTPTWVCPGTWLKYAVEIEMRKGKAESETGDDFDLDHVSYLPYVDVLTADSRIATWCEQVLRRGDLPPTLLQLAPPIRASNASELMQYLSERLALG